MISLNGGRISCYKNGSSWFEVSFDLGDNKNRIVFRLDITNGALYAVCYHNGNWSTAYRIN